MHQVSQYINAKSILGKLKRPDTWFGTTYSMNLYRGCSHGCIYCDSRSNCYQIIDFDRTKVKRNAIDILHKELRSKRHKGTIGFGSMNDCYAPIEEHYQLSRQALKLIAQYKFPIHIITKGTLVTRDIDLIKQISAIYAAVSLTITTADDQLASTIEPHAPSSTDRFKTLLKLREEGIYAGITMMPILPFINDNEENITKMVQMAAKHKAAYILASMGMTIRDGQREYYYAQLDKSFPGIRSKYMNRFKKQYACGAIDANHLWEVFQSECLKHNIPTKMDFYNPLQAKQQSLF